MRYKALHVITVLKASDEQFQIGDASLYKAFRNINPRRNIIYSKTDIEISHKPKGFLFFNSTEKYTLIVEKMTAGGMSLISS